MTNIVKIWRKPELHQLAQNELVDVILTANASWGGPGGPGNPGDPGHCSFGQRL